MGLLLQQEVALRCPAYLPARETNCRMRLACAKWRRAAYRNPHSCDQRVLDGIVSQLGVGAQAELLEHARAVGADRLDADPAARADLANRFTAGNQQQHFQLAVRQRLMTCRVTALPD